MNDPPRLIDDSPSEIEVALLRVGREYRSGPGTRAKTLAALGLVGSVGLVAKSSAAASLWSLKSWLIGGAVVGVAAAAAVFSTHSTEPSPPPVAAASGTVVDERTPPRARPPVEAAPREAKPEPAPPEPVVAYRATPSTSPTHATSISEELQAIDAARSAVASGNGAEALRLLDAHARRFPNGRLYLEAEVLRIEALARSGNPSAARSRARAFVERHPQSVFTPRVKRIADE